jgi:putative transposase
MQGVTRRLARAARNQSASARYQRRFPGLRQEDRVDVRARHAVPEIQGHLLEVSPDPMSTVADAVRETVAEWQNRPLEPMYPLVFFDALRVKIRNEGPHRSKAVYVALGVTREQEHPGPLDRDLGRR